MQHKIGSVALKAEDRSLDNLDVSESITIKEVKEIVDHLHKNDPWQISKYSSR